MEKTEDLRCLVRDPEALLAYLKGHQLGEV
jgi:hypothetical protein